METTGLMLGRMDKNAREHRVQFTRAGLEDLLDSLDKNNFIDEVTLEELGRMVAFIQVIPPVSDDTV